MILDMAFHTKEELLTTVNDVDIYIDLQQEPHSKLLQKLLHNAINRKIQLWINNFLTVKNVCSCESGGHNLNLIYVWSFPRHCCFMPCKCPPKLCNFHGQTAQ